MRCLVSRQLNSSHVRQELLYFLYTYTNLAAGTLKILIPSRFGWPVRAEKICKEGYLKLSLTLRTLIRRIPRMPQHKNYQHYKSQQDYNNRRHVTKRDGSVYILWGLRNSLIARLTLPKVARTLLIFCL